MIQLGKRNTLCTLLAVTVVSVSAGAWAQAPAPSPVTTPTPTPTDPAASPPETPPAPALNPAPAPAPEPAPPPATVFPTMAGSNLRLSELFSFRPGILLQFWAQAAQDSLPKANGDAGDFTKNFYLRRARFFLGGGLGKNLSYFLLWESANLGLATPNADGSVNKNYLSWAFNDAFLDYKFNPNISVQAGLQLIPFTRNILQSTATYWPIDIGGVSATYIAATQTQVLRDTGVQVKINAIDGHLEARAMVSQGVRVSDGAGRGPGKNDPRFTGFVQYNLFDTEAGYVFNGQYFGRKKMAGVALGADYQNTADANAYFATSATAFAAIPLNGADPKNGGDEVGGQVEFLHFHNGRIPTAALGKQNDLLVELGYYNKASKFSVFGKFEGRFFASDVMIGPGVTLDANNTRLYAGGLKYFLAEAIANLTLQYSFAQTPNQPSTVRNSTNLIQLQLQLAYY